MLSSVQPSSRRSKKTCREGMNCHRYGTPLIILLPSAFSDKCYFMSRLRIYRLIEQAERTNHALEKGVALVLCFKYRF